MAVGELEPFEHVGQFHPWRRRLAFEGACSLDLLDHRIGKLAPVRATPQPGDRLVVQEIDHEAGWLPPLHGANAAVDRKVESIAVPAQTLQFEISAVGPFQMYVAAIIEGGADVAGNEYLAAGLLQRAGAGQQLPGDVGRLIVGRRRLSDPRARHDRGHQQHRGDARERLDLAAETTFSIDPARRRAPTRRNHSSPPGKSNYQPRLSA